MSLQGLVTSQRLEGKKMKKKKFRRDTRFFTDVFFFKEKHSYTLQELSGDPQFWHPWKDCIVKHGGNLWHKEGK